MAPQNPMPHPAGLTRRDGTPSSVAIPHDDWDRAPWNRYAFKNVSEFTCTAPVLRGSLTTPLPAAPRELGAIAFELDGRRQTFAEFLAGSFTDGCLVLHDGSVVFEHYDNGMTPATRHLSQSMSKSLIGVLAGIFVGRGALDVAAPVTQYLPELAGTAYRGATLQQLLDMTSGVAWDEEYTSLESDIARMDAASGWKRPQSSAWPCCMWDLIQTLQRQDCPHGLSFRYRSIETDVLGFVLQRIGACPLAALLSRELWTPLGAENDAYFTVDPAGFACANGGFNATLRDYARFALMLAEGGMSGVRRVLPEDWIRATRAGDATRFGPLYRQVLPAGAYHNQFWLERPVDGPFMARGVFGQLLYVDPEARFAAVKLSSWPEFTDLTRTRTALAALRAVRDALMATAPPRHWSAASMLEGGTGRARRSALRRPR